MADFVENKKRFWAIMLIVSIFAIPVHELGHFLGLMIDGIQMINLTGVSVKGSGNSLLSVSAGPLISLGLALFCLFMLCISNKDKDIWGGCSFIMCLTRLVPYILTLRAYLFVKSNYLFTIQDEGRMADFPDLPLWSIYIIFIFLFIIIILLIVHNLKKSHISFIKISGYSLICYCMVMFIESRVLNNALFY